MKTCSNPPSKREGISFSRGSFEGGPCPAVDELQSQEAGLKMMVETVLESSHDFGMSNGSLPQWKRELLQRRAARARPPAPPAPPPEPPARPTEPDTIDDEELRYGPGIVKRLKSRYLSLALRDAPRRRPSVLRRAASLEHLLHETPIPPRTPAPRTTRPVSVAASPPQPPPARRESVKRARSVDALSRLDARDEPPPPPRVPPPPPPPPTAPRSGRPPRRPAPLLRDTERPPPDLVRSTMRKFEPAAVRRPTPAARVSAALRGLEAAASAAPRTSTPEPRRSPALSCDLSAVEESVDASMVSPPRAVSRAALEGIARAGSTTRYAFEAPRHGSHLPPLAATNTVLVGRARRVGVIRPMPAPAVERALSASLLVEEELIEKAPDEPPTPVPEETSPVQVSSPLPPSESPERKEAPPAAMVEPMPRSPSVEAPPPLPARSPTPPPRVIRETTPTLAESPPPAPMTEAPEKPKPLINGHAITSPPKTDFRKSPIIRIESEDRPCNGSSVKSVIEAKLKVSEETKIVNSAVPWSRTSPPSGRRGGRAPPPAATSVVFNFSSRKEVPDYVENDGLILRASRRDRIKAGESGVVVLRPEALTVESDEEVDAGPPSPCSVRFVNDNVLINGRSSMPTRPDRDRTARLKLQFDDSLTRTFEYPSETSLCEEDPEPHHCTPAPAALADNTHMASATLSRYTPSKTCADSFQLGVTRRTHQDKPEETNGCQEASAEEEDGCGDARPCGADARSWSDARRLHADLLF